MKLGYPPQEYPAPQLADFTWVNQGDSTVTQIPGGGLFLSGPILNSESLRILKQPAPAPPYRITAWFLPLLSGDSYPKCGLCWRQDNSGEVVIFGMYHDETLQETHILADKYNSPTDQSATYADWGIDWLASPLCFQLVDDGDYRKCRISQDGYRFREVHSVARTDFLLADQVGFFVNPFNASSIVGIHLLGWKIERGLIRLVDNLAGQS